MAVSIATLAGNRATAARAWLAQWGAWYADASLDAEVTLTGSIDLVIADLTLKGTVLSGGPDKGRSHYRIVGGAGGWGRTIPAKAYANDAGVKVSSVLTDAAREVGETIDAPATTRTGPAFLRPTARAASVLELLSPSAWYVGEDGVTRLGRRPSTTFIGTFSVVSPIDKAARTVTIASETIAKIVPGVTVAGIDAVDVLHEISPDGLRSTIWGALGDGGTSRRLAALRAIFEQLDPGRRFRGVTEYRVVTKTGKRLDLQPVRVSRGMPDLLRVPVRPGVPGCEPDVALGSRVLVGFVDSDPSLPYVCGFEDLDGEGFQPTTLTIAGGSAGVTRVGDSIKITAAALTAAGGANSSGPVTFSTDAIGTVTSGSSKVWCG